MRSCLAVLRTPSAVLLLLLSLTIELTVSILQLLCSHLILIPGLLRSAGVAVAMYFNGNPFTIGDRCYRARKYNGRHVGRAGKAPVKQEPMKVEGNTGGTNLQCEFIKPDGYRDFY